MAPKSNQTLTFGAAPSDEIMSQDLNDLNHLWVDIIMHFLKRGKGSALSHLLSLFLVSTSDELVLNIFKTLFLNFSEALKTRPTNRDDTFDGGRNGGP